MISTSEDSISLPSPVQDFRLPMRILPNFTNEFDRRPRPSRQGSYYEWPRQFSSECFNDSVSWKLGQSIPLTLANSHRMATPSKSSVFSQPQAKTILSTWHMMANEKKASKIESYEANALLLCRAFGLFLSSLAETDPTGRVGSPRQVILHTLKGETIPFMTRSPG